MKALAISIGEARVGLLEQTNDWEHRFSFEPSWLESRNSTTRSTPVSRESSERPWSGPGSQA